ncbi:MAG: SET domain-containing protein-lysine N-methyltransferase [Ferruginibacter sp.]
MIKPYLTVNEMPGKGRGVFTLEDISPGTTLEISPVIVMPGSDRLLLDKTLLHDYIFEWGINSAQCCMALGLIPIYNHNYHSNCEYFMDFEDETITVKAVKYINAGEEVTINYNGDWNNEKPVWFEVK